MVQHLNELHRAGRTGQRIACQLLHILRVCEPCTFSCPADSALNRFWLTFSAVGDRGIDIFLHGLQAVFKHYADLDVLVRVRPDECRFTIDRSRSGALLPDSFRRPHTDEAFTVIQNR